jgi:acyl dehydratase
MPGLKLTIAQATRLWHLDPRASEQLLNELVVDGMLRRSTDGAYLVSTDPARARAPRG